MQEQKYLQGKQEIRPEDSSTSFKMISNETNIHSFLLFFTDHLLFGGLELRDCKKGMWGLCFERYTDVVGW